MNSTGDNRLISLQNNFERKIDEKFAENERLKLTKNELDKEIIVLQAKCQNLQTNRSVSSFGDLTRDDLLKRIHDLEVELANKDQHYRNLISHGVDNNEGELDNLKQALDVKHNENVEFRDKHCQIEVERDQLMNIVEKLDNKLANTLDELKKVNYLNDGLKDQRDA